MLEAFTFDLGMPLVFTTVDSTVMVKLIKAINSIMAYFIRLVSYHETASFTARAFTIDLVIAITTSVTVGLAVTSLAVTKLLTIMLVITTTTTTIDLIFATIIIVSYRNY